jgi:hypothetical protein
MGATASLSIEVFNLHVTKASVRSWWRRNREIPYEAVGSGCFLHGHITGPNVQASAYNIVDRGFQRAKPIVINFRKIEIHMRSAVRRDLGAGHQRTLELLEHESIENMRARVQLRNEMAVLSIDRNANALSLWNEPVDEMPGRPPTYFNTRNVKRAEASCERTTIRRLTASSRMKP